MSRDSQSPNEKSNLSFDYALPSDLLSEIEVFRLVDLRDPNSLDVYFPKQEGKGFYEPISSVTGCCKDFRVVFQAIRSWRNLTSEKQQALKMQCASRSSQDQKKSIDNINYLSKEENKELLISDALSHDQGRSSPLPHNSELFKLGLFAAPYSASIISAASDQIPIDSIMATNVSVVQGRGIVNAITTATSLLPKLTSQHKKVPTTHDSDIAMVTKAVIDKMLVFMKYQAVFNDSIKHTNESELKHSVISLTTRSIPYSNIHGGKSTRMKLNSPNFCATGSSKVEIVGSMLLFLSSAIDELNPTEHSKLINLIGETSIRKVTRSLSDLMLDRENEYSDLRHCDGMIQDSKSESHIQWVVSDGGLLKDRVETFKIQLLENRSKASTASDQVHKKIDHSNSEKKRKPDDNHLLEVINKKPKLVPSFQEYAATVDDS